MPQSQAGPVIPMVLNLVAKLKDIGDQLARKSNNSPHLSIRESLSVDALSSQLESYLRRLSSSAETTTSELVSAAAAAPTSNAGELGANQAASGQLSQLLQAKALARIAAPAIGLGEPSQPATPIEPSSTEASAALVSVVRQQQQQAHSLRLENGGQAQQQAEQHGNGGHPIGLAPATSDELAAAAASSSSLDEPAGEQADEGDLAAGDEAADEGEENEEEEEEAEDDIKCKEKDCSDLFVDSANNNNNIGGDPSASNSIVPSASSPPGLATGGDQFSVDQQEQTPASVYVGHRTQVSLVTPPGFTLTPNRYPMSTHGYEHSNEIYPELEQRDNYSELQSSASSASAAAQITIITLVLVVNIICCALITSKRHLKIPVMSNISMHL